MSSLFSGGGGGGGGAAPTVDTPWDPKTGKLMTYEPERAWDPAAQAPFDPGPQLAHDPFYDLYPYLKPPDKQALPSIPQWSPPETTGATANATTTPDITKPTYKPKKTVTILTTKPGDLVPNPTGKKTLLGQ